MDLSSDDDDFRVIQKPPMRRKPKPARRVPASKRTVPQREKKPRIEPTRTETTKIASVNHQAPKCVSHQVKDLSCGTAASVPKRSPIVLTDSPLVNCDAPIVILDSPMQSHPISKMSRTDGAVTERPPASNMGGVHAKMTPNCSHSGMDGAVHSTAFREVREVLPQLSSEAITSLLARSGGEAARGIQMHFSQQVALAADLSSIQVKGAAQSKAAGTQSQAPQSALQHKLLQKASQPVQQPKAAAKGPGAAAKGAGAAATGRVNRSAAPLKCVLCGLKTGGAYKKADGGGWQHVQCAPKRKATARQTGGARQALKQPLNDSTSKQSNAFEMMGAGAEAEHKERIKQLKQRAGVTMGYVQPPEELMSKPEAASTFEAYVTRFTGQGSGTVTLRISQKQLESEIPCSMAYNVLPAEIAHDILATFSQESRKLRQGSQFIYDKRIIAERLSTGLYIPDPTESRSGRDTKRERRWENSGFLDLVRASKGVAVRAVRRQRENRPKPPSTSVQNWVPKRCIVNIYRDGQDHTGPHSDPLSSIGPHAIIGSLSLGAARTFKLSVVTGHRAAHGVRQGEQHTRGIASSYSIVLPHNSLLIMWEGCQENFHHSVPKQPDEAFEHHDIFGSMRVNLTFRHSRQEWSGRAPQCKCGVKCNLKPVLKPGPNRGRYCWLCPSKRNESCGFFQWECALDGNCKATLGAPALRQDESLMKGGPISPHPLYRVCIALTSLCLSSIHIKRGLSSTPATKQCSKGP